MGKLFVSGSEQIMSADKYLSIFSRQMEAIVYLYHARVVATINCFLVALENEICKAYQYYLIFFVKNLLLD